jgi:hypothetical protein
MTRPTLHTLSPEAARQLRQILARPAPGRPPEFRFPVGLEVRVVRAGAEAGTSPRVYHEGMLRDIRGLETGDHEDAGTEHVFLADLDGGSLTEDADYLAIRGGEWPDAEDVPRPLYWCHSGGGGGVWMARLTTKHATHSRWKYVRQKLTAATPPVWADDGAESADYTAVPSTIDGTDLANPVAGLRVVMWESAARAGYQEFLPIGYADATHPGLVSTTGQSFEGGKTFLQLVTALSGILTGNGTTGDGQINIQEFGSSQIGAVNVSGTPFLVLSDPNSGGFWTFTATYFDNQDPNPLLAVVEYGISVGNSSGTELFFFGMRTDSGGGTPVMKWPTGCRFYHGGTQVFW